MNKIDKKGLWLFIVATLVAFTITIVICLTVVRSNIEKQQTKQTESISIAKPPDGKDGG